MQICKSPVIKFQSALYPDLATRPNHGLRTDRNHAVESVVIEDFADGGDLPFADGVGISNIFDAFRLQMSPVLEVFRAGIGGIEKIEGLNVEMVPVRLHVGIT